MFSRRGRSIQPIFQTLNRDISRYNSSNTKSNSRLRWISSSKRITKNSNFTSNSSKSRWQGKSRWSKPKSSIKALNRREPAQSSRRRPQSTKIITRASSNSQEGLKISKTAKMGKLRTNSQRCQTLAPSLPRWLKELMLLLCQFRCLNSHLSKDRWKKMPNTWLAHREKMTSEGKPLSWIWMRHLSILNSSLSRTPISFYLLRLKVRYVKFTFW